MKRRVSQPDAGFALGPETLRHVAARRMFRDARDMLVQCVLDWRKARDIESLHQFRVGIRRFRVLLRVFEMDAAAVGGRDLRHRLGQVTDVIGVVRDLDTMTLLVAELKGKKRKKTVAAGRSRLLKQIEQVRSESLVEVVRVLEGVGWDRTRKQVDAFIARLDRVSHTGDRQTLQNFFKQETTRHARRICRTSDMAQSTDVETLHDFRIKLRRFRYLGDLLGPLVKKRKPRIFKDVHVAELPLSRIHDLDMAVRFLDLFPVSGTQSLRKTWRAERKKRITLFRKTWGSTYPKLLKKANRT